MLSYQEKAPPGVLVHPFLIYTDYWLLSIKASLGGNTNTKTMMSIELDKSNPSYHSRPSNSRPST